MAFQALQKKERGFNRNTPMESKVSLSKYKGASLHVHLSPLVVDRLGWAKGERAAVSVGSGNDAGWILIEKVKSGGYSMSSTGGTMSSTGCTKTKAIKIGFQGLLDSLKQASITPCKFNIVNQSLYVEIPERLRRVARPFNAETDAVLRQQPFKPLIDVYVSPRVE
jgi:hypothetical protein